MTQHSSIFEERTQDYPVIFPSERDFALLLFQLFALLSLGAGPRRVVSAGSSANRVGEILAGVLLGPSVRGVLAPNLSSALFRVCKRSF
jgi:hypothetical protein